MIYPSPGKLIVGMRHPVGEYPLRITPGLEFAPFQNAGVVRPVRFTHSWHGLVFFYTGFPANGRLFTCEQILLQVTSGVSNKF